ncbi:MAG: hypothetical protein CTY25_12560 [Methylobacterium sp.]|nr:MAG: hypothetical protein CTY25_12560 [Methylobacterium sp.]
MRRIRQNDRRKPCERITHVGGRTWTLETADVIARIESRKEAFYVSTSQGELVDVVVSINRHGQKFLRTTVDGDEPSHLLSLPESL